jgi:hypothetical protein
MEQPIPTFGKIISHDRNFQFALALTVLPIFIIVMSLIQSGVSLAFWLNISTIFLFGASIVGAIWLTVQYIQVMTTFRDGMTVKGTLTHTERKSQPRQNGKRTAYIYYAVIEYSFNNETFEKRFKLPGQPERYGLEKGMTLDLILREEKPKTVFIKKLYLD